MRPILAAHIFAGSLGIVSGFVALYSLKGATIHRKAGMVFVYTMLVMCAAGFYMTVRSGVATAMNASAAVVTACLVLSSLTTVRPPSPALRQIDLFVTLVLAVVAVIDLSIGSQAAANGGQWRGLPAFPFFMFGIAATLAVAGDIRVMRNGALRGAQRIARHLWRMSFALFVAVMSFFIGQAKVIPKPIRIMPLLALPALVVLITLIYWMWRVRLRQSLRNLQIRADYRNASQNAALWALKKRNYN